MKISTKLRYGLRAILYIAGKFKKGMVSRKEIIEHEDIPGTYLRNILTALVNGGLIISIKGSRGGFALSRPPEQITVLDVMEALEGKLNIAPCIQCAYICERSSDCNTRPLWEEVETVNKNLLKKYTIRNFMENNLSA